MNNDHLVSDETFVGVFTFLIAGLFSTLGAWIMGPLGAFFGLGVFSVLLLCLLKFIDERY